MPKTVLDHVGDVNGSELHAFSKVYGFPDFVKKANMAETCRPGDLPESVYADPRQRLFPCHNAASTWLSALYFAEKRSAYHVKDAARIEQRLAKAVNYWGIKAAVDQMLTRYEETHKTADDRLPDSDFAYVWTADNGIKQRHWRMKNAMEVQAAAKSLFEYRDRLPFTDRNVIAAKILEKAARYGASLGQLDLFVEKQAGHGVCDPKEVAVAIRNRAKLARDPAVREQIEKLATLVSTKPRYALDPQMLTKLAATLDQIDRGLGITQYSAAIPRPEDLVFKITYKEAQAGVGNAVALTTGKIYDKTAFEKISLTDLQDLFGSDIASQVGDGLYVDVQKLAEVAETLPRPDAELFERLLEETGIPPIHTKASNDRYGLRGPAVAELAATY